MAFNKHGSVVASNVALLDCTSHVLRPEPLLTKHMGPVLSSHSSNTLCWHFSSQASEDCKNYPAVPDSPRPRSFGQSWKSSLARERGRTLEWGCRRLAEVALMQMLWYADGQRMHLAMSMPSPLFPHFIQ